MIEFPDLHLHCSYVTAFAGLWRVPCKITHYIYTRYIMGYKSMDETEDGEVWRRCEGGNTTQILNMFREDELRVL